MKETMTFTGTLIVTNCWCGLVHAVPQDLYNHMERQQRDGHTQSGIFCPMGHKWTFAGVGEAEQERKRRERAEVREQQIRDQLEAEKRSHSATKGNLTKTLNRIGNGTCPQCNRHFVNVERHMVSKHGAP